MRFGVAWSTLRVWLFAAEVRTALRLDDMLLDALQFGLLASAMAGLFHYVPNTPVRWRHAWAGALFVAAGFNPRSASASILEDVRTGVLRMPWTEATRQQRRSQRRPRRQPWDP